jgi:DNA-binding NtrC family response regulator
MARILVVEDEETLRVLAQSIFEDMGHETANAATAEEALALLVTDKFDLLFSDIGLREDMQGGIALAREARNMQPELPVLYTTGQGITDGMRALMVEGFGFIPKPYTIEALGAALRNVLKEDARTNSLRDKEG